MTEIKYCIRFSDGLRPRLKAAAKHNRRSMHAEILSRLSHTYNADIPGSVFAAMGERNADKTLLRMDVETHTSLKSAALANARSLNAEMVYRLLASFEAEGTPTSPPPVPAVERNELKALRRTVATMLAELDRLIGEDAA